MSVRPQIQQSSRKKTISTVSLFHIKMSATSINMEEPQPRDSQNWIIEPSDCRPTITPTCHICTLYVVSVIVHCVSVYADMF